MLRTTKEDRDWYSIGTIANQEQRKKLFKKSIDVTMKKENRNLAENPNQEKLGGQKQKRQLL